MKSITEDILEWSEKYLEPKNEHLGNVPVCPYARTARLKKTFRILECKKFVNFQDAIIGGAKIAKDPEVQIVIVACDDIGYEPEELDSVIDILNRIIDLDLHKKINHIFVETHERFSHSLGVETAKLKLRIKKLKIKNINLDWV